MNETLDKSSQTVRDRLSAFVKSFGLPRLIIAAFLLMLFIAAPFVGADFWTQISNTINRFSWNAVLVLAMVPMIHSGCGLNFGLPLGIISGLLGATLSIEFGFTGPMSFVMAILIATVFAVVLGSLYGWLLNKIKGGEMMIATYVGFSSVSFMCMMWLLLPYKSPTMVWGLSGKGLRTTLAGRLLRQGSGELPADQHRQSLHPHGQPSVLCAAGLRHVGFPAFQNRHGNDRRRLQPDLCPGGRRQCGPDPDALRDYLHMACRNRHSGL